MDLRVRLFYGTKKKSHGLAFMQELESRIEGTIEMLEDDGLVVHGIDRNVFSAAQVSLQGG